MARAKVFLKSIDVHNTDEDDGAEWHFTMGVSDSNERQEFLWEWDDVDSAWSYVLGPVWEFDLNPGEQLYIYAQGYEEDDPGFPLFDDHDPIPGFGFWVDPASDAVKLGNDYIVNGVNQDFNYTLHYDFQYSSTPWEG